MGKKATVPGSGWRTETPSKRYSFTRGRPPLIRGKAEPGGRATPGTSATSGMKLRPFKGSPTTLLREMTCPRPEDWERRSDASATTVVVSDHALELERRVDAKPLPGRDPHAFPKERLEARRLELDPVEDRAEGSSGGRDPARWSSPCTPDWSRHSSRRHGRRRGRRRRDPGPRPRSLLARFGPWRAVRWKSRAIENRRMRYLMGDRNIGHL